MGCKAHTCSRSLILHIIISYPVLHKNWRQQLNEWKQQHPEAIVTSIGCNTVDQQHQCNTSVYGMIFKSKFYAKKDDAKEDAAEQAVNWARKPGKTRLKEFCDLFKGKRLEPEYNTITTDSRRFQSLVKIKGLELETINGDVKDHKTDAEHSAAEKALNKIQYKVTI